jgi:predicted O-methyltransferase YrrM
MTRQPDISTYPSAYEDIKLATAESNFPMASDVLTCSLLRTLVASKPGCKLLELGTGTGISTSWILDGMDKNAELISIDNDPEVQAIAARYLIDNRLTLICTDGNKWIKENTGSKFSFIFADAWPGKYQQLDETLSMLEKGGFYVIDDMLPQPNWPVGHADNVDQLLAYLDSRSDIILTKQNWASGIVICIKR